MTVLTGDCLALLPTLEAGSVDAIATDPPYGLAFMGKAWDHGVPGVPFWEAALRVAKPGAHLVAFGGTRTYHRLTCAIEDAGWEIRDCLSWLYGSGFPKSRDIGKDFDKGLRPVIGTQEAPGHARANVEQGAQSRSHLTFAKYSADPVTALAAQWQGWGTALKPAWEPIILARKPLVGTVAGNVAAHGTGAINVDGCRIATEEDRARPPRTANAIFGNGRGTNLTASQNNALGRWPANLILDPEAARLLDEQSGECGQAGDITGDEPSTPSKNVYGEYGRRAFAKRGCTGGASRFFYCAKASRAEREEGVEGETRRVGSESQRTDAHSEATGNLTTPARNHHPTVKPVALMRWLCRLVTPPGGLILDPFTGSGSTGVAAILEGFRYLGIEREPEYVAIAEARIAKASQQPSLWGAL